MVVTSFAPCYRVALAVDIEGSTWKSNRDKARMRDLMYDIIAESMIASEIDEHRRDSFIDRGDGLLVLIHPLDCVPKTVLLSDLIPTINRLLVQSNNACVEDQLRLRSVVHAGEVHYDSRGPFGETLDVAFRLLDAQAVKVTLRKTAAPLVLVVSGEIYSSVVRHGYDGIDPQAFKPIAPVRVANRWQRGWLNVPGEGRPW